MLKKTEKRAGKQKVTTALFLCLIYMILSAGFGLGLTGCSSGAGASQSRGQQSGESLNGESLNGQDDRLNVVTTIFPYYDFLRQIAGDRIRLTLVVPAGMDSHSFEPTPADMITIQNADLLICNGGAMEQWVDRVVTSFGEGEGPGRVETMMDYVDTVQEEIVEGMEHSHGHDAETHNAATCEIEEHHHEEHPQEEHPHEDEGPAYVDDGHGHEIEYDEHIWTSPVNAMELTRVLSEVLSEEDSEHAESYRANAAAYITELEELDARFREVVAHGSRRLLVFGDKFPLRYFFDEYGLEYRAAFSGCSSDTEPSAKTIAYLIDKVREEEIPAVYYLELSSPRVAEIISEETGAEPLLFHTCHNLTRRQFDSGVTYLDLMRANVAALQKGLNEWDYY